MRKQSSTYKNSLSIFVLAIISFLSSFSYGHAQTEIDSITLVETIHANIFNDRERQYFLVKDDVLKYLDKINNMLIESGFRTDQFQGAQIVKDYFSDQDSLIIDTAFLDVLANNFWDFRNTQLKYGRGFTLQVYTPIEEHIAIRDKKIKVNQSIYDDFEPIKDRLLSFGKKYALYDERKKTKKWKTEDLYSDLNDIRLEIEVIIKKWDDDNLVREYSNYILQMSRIDEYLKKFGVGIIPPEMRGKTKLRSDQVSLRALDTLGYAIRETANLIESSKYNLWQLKREKKVLNFLSKGQNFSTFTILRLLNIPQGGNYDTLWLENRIDHLNTWLEATSLHKAFTYNSLRTDRQGRFYLKFDFAFEDLVDHYWQAYTQKYYADNGMQLEERLIFKLAHLFRVAPEFINVEINSYCFDISFNYLEGKLDYVPMGACESGVHGVTIEEEEIKKMGMNLAKTSKQNIEVSKKQLVRTIHKLVLEYFEDKEIDIDEDVQKIKIEDNEVILFLNNTRKEVLKNQNYWENIQYTFKIKETDAGYDIKLIADGEFGTGAVILGFGRPPSYEAYKSMEPKYKDQLQRYTSDFLNRLKEKILGDE